MLTLILAYEGYALVYHSLGYRQHQGLRVGFPSSFFGRYNGKIENFSRLDRAPAGAVYPDV